MAEELLKPNVEPVVLDEEVEIVDDRPDDERHPVARTQTPVEAESDKTAKRIRTLLYEKTAEQIRANKAERELDAANKFNAALIARTKHAEQTAFESQKAWKHEAVGKRDSDLKVTKTEFMTAREANDAAKEADINAQIARITTEKNDIEKWNPYLAPEIQQPQFAAPQQQPEQTATEVDLNWAKANEWAFDAANAEKVEFAKEVEVELAARGYRKGTKECYDAIDAALQNKYPEQFGEKPAAARRTTSPVMGAPRTNGTQKNGKITLTASEAAIARQMGISYADYFKYKEVQ